MQEIYFPRNDRISPGLYCVPTQTTDSLHSHRLYNLKSSITEHCLTAAQLLKAAIGTYSWLLECFATRSQICFKIHQSYALHLSVVWFIHLKIPEHGNYPRSSRVSCFQSQLSYFHVFFLTKRFRDYRICIRASRVESVHKCCAVPSMITNGILARFHQ
jgi:hypothetical protein